MLCYKDRSFCMVPCANLECHRVVTDEVLEGSKKTGLPISIADYRTPDCGYLPKEKEKK